MKLVSPTGSFIQKGGLGYGTLGIDDTQLLTATRVVLSEKGETLECYFTQLLIVC
jgi:hypothetical protein